MMDTISGLITQIRKEMPFLPEDWDDEDIQTHALQFFLSNGDAVEELFGDLRTFAVTIKGSVIKTISVEAENEDDAVEQAHKEFSILADGNPEDYNQETVSVEDTT